MDIFKNVTIFEVLTFVLALAALIMVAVMLSKVKKCCKNNENYHNVKDIGPVASNKKISLPTNSQFASSCQNAFQNQCNSTSNVCGDDSGNVACQDFTDMDDQSCYNMNAKYVAYTSDDCNQPYNYTGGYLCGGGSGDVMDNPCPSIENAEQRGITVLGNAPENPYGCTNICQ